jgi:hypothetical protein
MYDMYYSFYGIMSQVLEGYNNNGWSIIDNIKSIRKQIRKLNIKLRQEEQDIEVSGL